MDMIVFGALRHDAFDADYVIASSGVMRTTMADGDFFISISTRSAIDSERDTWDRRYREILELLGFTGYKLVKCYGGWPERKDSALQKIADDAHKKLFGCPIPIEHIHGGIEASFVIMAHPDTDIIGIEPSAKGAHTLDEHLYIDEVKDYWALMKAILSARING